MVYRSIGLLDRRAASRNIPTLQQRQFQKIQGSLGLQSTPWPPFLWRRHIKFLDLRHAARASGRVVAARRRRATARARSGTSRSARTCPTGRCARCRARAAPAGFRPDGTRPHCAAPPPAYEPQSVRRAAAPPARVAVRATAADRDADGASGGAGGADGVELLGAGASGDVFEEPHVSGVGARSNARAPRTSKERCGGRAAKAARAHPHRLLPRVDRRQRPAHLLLDVATMAACGTCHRRRGRRAAAAACGARLAAAASGMGRAASALAACHALASCRDVSPFNVLVKLSPSPARLKLAEPASPRALRPLARARACARRDGAPPSGVCEATPLDSALAAYSPRGLGTTRYSSAVDVCSAARRLRRMGRAAPSASSGRLDRIVTLVERARRACALEAATLDEVLAAALSGALTPAPGSRPSAATLASACAAPAANASAAAAAAWPKV